MRRATLAALVLMTVGRFQPAQATCRFSRDYEGEDRSFVGWSPQKVGYRDDDGTNKSSLMILSAQISMTVPAGAVCGSPQHGEALWQFLPSLNLAFTQLGEHSSAVLPPSFNPRILRASFRYRWWPGAKAPFNPNGREWALGAIVSGWSHHSNGQYAPTYYDAAGNPTDDLSKAAAANRENGDFSTNYLSGKIWLRRSRLDDNGDRPRQGVFAALEYQFHHGAVFPGALEDKLRPIWGRHHVLLSALYRTGYQHDPKGDVAPSDSLGGAYWLVAADAWWVIGADSAPVVSSWQWRGAVEAAWFVPKYLGPAGLFVRADVGRNPLNLRFVENRNEIIFGIMLDTSQSIERLTPVQQN